MWQKLPAFIRNWPILIIGVVLIVPFLYLTSSQGPSSQPSTAAHNQSGETGSRPAPVPSVPAEKTAARTASTPSSTQAPAMSHERRAAAPAATSGQAAPPPKIEDAAVSGDVATGKLPIQTMGHNVRGNRRIHRRRARFAPSFTQLVAMP